MIYEESLEGIKYELKFKVFQHTTIMTAWKDHIINKPDYIG